MDLPRKIRLSATRYNLAIRGTATIGNLFLRKPHGDNLNPGRGPARHAPRAPAGATLKVLPPKTRTKPKKDPPTVVPEFSSSSSNPKSI
eukprot:6840712-Pyramimonas_sp.AAC.1